MAEKAIIKSTDFAPELQAIAIEVATSAIKEGQSDRDKAKVFSFRFELLNLMNTNLKKKKIFKKIYTFI